jgi:phage recombination protein Bet
MTAAPTAPPAEKALVNVGMDPALAEARQIQSNLALVKSVLAPDLNDQEMLLFAMVAQRSRLDPFAKQIYAIKRQGKLTFQTGIDGFRSSAEETDQYRGSDEAEFGPIVEKPFPHPEWASVVIHRAFPDGHEVAQSSGKIYFDEFYPGDQQGFQWRKMPRVMLSKCAEAAAFRKAFPKRFADVYAPEEMAQADRAETARPVGPTARERAAERRAAIEAQTTGSGTPPPPDAGSPAGSNGPATEPEADTPTASGSPQTGEPIEGEYSEVQPVQCNAESPYEGNARCRMTAGHDGMHKSSSKESWS